MLSLKDKIWDRIVSRGDYVSFAELTDLQGFRGAWEWGLKGKNVCFWTGMSEEAVDALTSLELDGRITLKPCDQLVYLHDGAVLKLPIAKRANHVYKKPHWLPVVIKRMA